MISQINSEYNPKNDITIFNGNCIDLLEQIEDNSLQLIITSPPYNIGKEYEKRKPLKDYIEFQKKVIDLCANKLKPSGSICWQVGNYLNGTGKGTEVFPLDIILYDLFKQNKLSLRNRIVWYFGHGLHGKYRLSGRHETILWFTKTDEYTFDLDPLRVDQKYPGKNHYKGEKKGEPSGNKKGKNPGDVLFPNEIFAENEFQQLIYNIPNVKANHVEKTTHPAQYPIALVKRLIEGLSNKGDTVFDPFLGSGTTVAAAILSNRKAIGSELDQAYCKIALERAKQAIDNKLPEREDKPPYTPPKNTPLTTKPWK